MTNEKNLAKGLIISASIIGGSILLTGALGIFSHVIFAHKKPQPYRENTCCEKRIIGEHDGFKKDSKAPHRMKNHEFKGDNKNSKPESKNEEPKGPENKPTGDNQEKPQS